MMYGQDTADFFTSIQNMLYTHQCVYKKIKETGLPGIIHMFVFMFISRFSFKEHLSLQTVII